MDSSASEYLSVVQNSIDFAYNNYLYENTLPTNWISGWQYGFDKDETRDIMDVASSAETFALLVLKDELANQ